MRHKIVLAGVLVLAAVLTVAVGGGLGATPTANETSDHRTVAVTGTGEIDAAPDAAVVQLSVTARGPDAANVSDEVASGAERLRQALAEFGLDESAVQTQRYAIYQEGRPDEANGQPVYVGEQSFEVTIEDVDRVGALVDAAVDGGADDVGGVYYTLSDERRDSVRADALRAAVDDARGEAGVIASATGLQLGDVRSASSRATDVSPFRTEFATADAGGGTDIDPRDVTVSATVEVTFDATAA